MYNSHTNLTLPEGSPLRRFVTVLCPGGLNLCMCMLCAVFLCVSKRVCECTCACMSLCVTACPIYVHMFYMPVRA